MADNKSINEREGKIIVNIIFFLALFLIALFVLNLVKEQLNPAAGRAIEGITEIGTSPLLWGVIGLLFVLILLIVAITKWIN